MQAIQIIIKEVVRLYSRFESLTEEKKKKIIDVCIEEFSQNGYINASTNSIVKNAEISKGILFHYFGSKKSLYLYVVDYVISFLTEVTFKRMLELPSDFFERIREIGIIKLKTAFEYPVEYKFIIDIVTHTPEELKQEVQGRYERLYKENIPFLFKDIDTSNFRSGINKDKAMELIMFSLEGVSNKYFKAFESMPANTIMIKLEGITKDFNEYIEILKNGVCR